MAVNVGTLMVEIGANVSRLQKDMGKANRILENNQRRMQQQFKSLKRAAVGVFSAREVAAFAREVFDATLRLQRLESTYAAVEGTQRTGLATLRFIREETERLGLSYFDTAESAKSFFAAAEGSTLEKEARTIVTSVLEAGSALNLTAEQIDGTLLALEQMLSKGKISMEELRRQLGDRLPGAFKLVARALNVTTQELDAMVSNGQLYAEELLPKIAAEMHKTYGPAALENAKKLRGEMGRLTTAWDVFKSSVAESDTFAALARFATETLKNITPVNDELERMKRELAVLEKIISQPLQIDLATGTPIGDPLFIAEKKRIAELNKAIAELTATRKKDDEEAAGAGKRIAKAKAGLDLKAGEAEVAKAIKEIERLEKEKLTIREKFLDSYKKATLSTFNYELDQLNISRDKYLEAGANRVKVDEWYTTEFKRLSKERTDTLAQEEEDSLRASEKWQDGLKRGFKDYAEQAKDAATSAEYAVSSAFQGMEDAIIDFTNTGKANFSDFATSVLNDIQRILIRTQITGPLAKSLTGLFSGGGYTPQSAPFREAGLGGFANGGVLSGGNIASYSGSVVSTPTFFTGSPKAFADGGNVMGEAGPEGIFPLTRINGKLGIKAEGSGRAPVTNVTIINKSGAQASTQEQDNATGGKNITVTIDEMVSNAMTKQGSKTNKALFAQTQTSPPLVRR